MSVSLSLSWQGIRIKRTGDVVDVVLDNQPVPILIIVVRPDVGGGEGLVGHFFFFCVFFESPVWVFCDFCLVAARVVFCSSEQMESLERLGW